MRASAWRKSISARYRLTDIFGIIEMRQRFGSRIADEPEVEFYAWKIDDTYFDAYLAWDAKRMLEDAFPDFTVRVNVFMPGVMRKVKQTDFGFIRKTAEPLHGRMPNAGTASLLFFCGLTRRFPRRNA